MRPLIFLHLPKAAGSTLRTILLKKYRLRQRHHLSGNPFEAEEFTRLPEDERYAIDLLTGHQHFGMHRWLRPGARYITMLRDPVERCISHYYFVLRRPDHYLHQRVTEEQMSLYDYVTRRTTKELDNDQVRWLNDDGHRAAPFGAVNDKMLHVAQQRLAEGIEIIGLAERFDESLQMIADRLGWDDVQYESVNVTTGRPRASELDQRTLEVIRHYNRFDSQLYEFAQRLFADRLKEYKQAA